MSAGLKCGVSSKKVWKKHHVKHWSNFPAHSLNTGLDFSFLDLLRLSSHFTGEDKEIKDSPEQ